MVLLTFEIDRESMCLPIVYRFPRWAYPLVVRKVGFEHNDLKARQIQNFPYEYEGPANLFYVERGDP